MFWLHDCHELVAWKREREREREGSPKSDSMWMLPTICYNSELKQMMIREKKPWDLFCKKENNVKVRLLVNFWGAVILKSLSNSVNTACYIFYLKKSFLLFFGKYIYIWVFKQFGVRLPVKLSVSDDVHTYSKRNIAHWNAKCKIPGKLIECIAVIFFFLSFSFLPLTI